MEKLALIIPAAGSGSRLKRETPKPYIKICDATILEHTIRPFTQLDNLCKVVIATSQTYLQEAEKIAKKAVSDFVEVVIVEGGAERQDSIYNALQTIKVADLTAIHDAVRPFILPSQIRACCNSATVVGAAIIAVPAKDTIKQVGKNNIIQSTPDRSTLWQAQTPQIFQTDIIKEAYAKAKTDGIVGTDDASLVEYLGNDVKVVEGSRENFKITYPLDLQVANTLLENHE